MNKHIYCLLKFIEQKSSTNNIMHVQNTKLVEGSRNSAHGNEHAHNVHAKSFLQTRNYAHVNQSKHH